MMMMMMAGEKKREKRGEPWKALFAPGALETQQKP